MRIWLLNEGRAPLFRSEPPRESRPYPARASSSASTPPLAPRESRRINLRRGGRAVGEEGELQRMCPLFLPSLFFFPSPYPFRANLRRSGGGVPEKWLDNIRSV